MAQQGVHGGGHGGGLANAAGVDDRHLLRERRAVLTEFLRGNNDLSILNDDAIVTMFLEESGRVGVQELQRHLVPENYMNENVGIMHKIVALMNHYDQMSIKRRKILFLKLITVKGLGRICFTDVTVLRKSVLKEYLEDKDGVFDLYRKVKHVKANFLRVPHVFHNLPVLLPVQKLKK